MSDQSLGVSFRDKYKGDGANSTHTNQLSLSTDNKTLKDDNVSKEEKLKKRRERLAAYRLQKEKELGRETNNTTNAVDLEEEKKRLLEQKIEEWKKKRLQTAESEEQKSSTRYDQAGTKKNKTSISVKKLKTKINLIPNQKKRLRFDQEDEDPGDLKKTFKKPILSSNSYNEINKESDRKETADELDAFLDSLNDPQKTPVPTEFSHESALETTNAKDNEEDLNGEYSDSDEELNTEEEQRRILTSKLSKLQNKEKDLEKIDHDTIDYKPFRKNFYKEPFEVKSLADHDVESWKLELSGIKTIGKDCPKPIFKWSQLGLPSQMMSIIEDKLGYEHPTAIQCQALPAIMSGKDIIGVAKTGSGKTLSFVLPMIRHIQDQESLKKGDGPIGLILAPTRELSLQIYRQLAHFSKKLQFTASCSYGGASIEPQIADLKKGVEIIVGTPGRVIDLLAANGGRVTNLKRVTFLVLDEADRMFDSGFEPQILKIISQIRPDRQTVLFSATFPKKMELLAKKHLNNPIQIIVGGISVVAPEITQKVELFDEANESQDLESHKFERLVSILKETTASDIRCKILIFVERQSAADDLLVKLLSEGLSSLAIHGGKDQVDRKHAIKDFSSSTTGINILIATSIAARGLDVKNLKLVINYDPANHLEDYVHRVGRTGRAGKKGTAITFVSSSQVKAIADLVKAMTLSKVPEDQIPPKLVQINKEFLEQVKTGKTKSSFGFGGKGLGNLQEVRETTKELQRQAFGIVSNDNNSSIKKEDQDTPGPNHSESDDNKELFKFEIIEGRAPETSGPDKCKFHTRITINDLPQKARWVAVNGNNLSKIIESTSTSITSKGQFYPPNAKIPKPTVKNGKEVPPVPKLYLLVEGLTENSVKEASNMIRQNMIEGLEIAEKEQIRAPPMKYSV